MQKSAGAYRGRRVEVRDVAPYTIAVGSPCRPVGKVKIGKDGEIELEMFGSAETR